MPDEHELVAALRRRVQELRADPAASPAKSVTAFEQWFHQACNEGEKPDAVSQRPRRGGR